MAIIISGSFQGGNTGIAIFLQPAVTVASIQPTISTVRVIYSVAAVSTISYAVSAVRAAAKPAAPHYDNSTVLPTATVNSSNITRLNTPGTVNMNGSYAGPTTSRSNYNIDIIGGLGSSQDYAKAGGVIGGAAGCGIGAGITLVGENPELAPAGCAIGSDIIGATGAVLFGTAGFILGVFNLPGSEAFSQ